jgi:hypothetical protein
VYGKYDFYCVDCIFVYARPPARRKRRRSYRVHVYTVNGAVVVGCVYRARFINTAYNVPASAVFMRPEERLTSARCALQSNRDPNAFVSAGRRICSVFDLYSRSVLCCTRASEHRAKSAPTRIERRSEGQLKVTRGPIFRKLKSTGAGA